MAYIYEPATTTLWIYDEDDVGPLGGHAAGAEHNVDEAYAYMNTNYPRVWSVPVSGEYAAGSHVRCGYIAGKGFADSTGTKVTRFRIGHPTGFGTRFLRMGPGYSLASVGTAANNTLYLGNQIGSADPAYSGLFLALLEQTNITFSWGANFYFYHAGVQVIGVASYDINFASALGITQRAYDSFFDSPRYIQLGTAGAPYAKFYRCEFRQLNVMAGNLSPLLILGADVDTLEDPVFVVRQATYVAGASSNQWLGWRTPRFVFGAVPSDFAYVRTPSGAPSYIRFVAVPWDAGKYRFAQTYSEVRLSTAVRPWGVGGNAHDFGLYYCRVVDASGNPVQGARVRVTNNRPAAAGGPTTEVDTLTDANGNITFTPPLWANPTISDPTARDGLFLGAYYKNPVNPGAPPYYLFQPFGPFTLEVTKDSDKVTRTLHWPTKQSADACGWYPVDKVYDVIRIPGPEPTVEGLYFREGDVALLFEIEGQLASIAGISTKGILRRYTEEVLAGQWGVPVLGTGVVLTIQTGSLPGLGIGVLLGTDGRTYKVREYRQIGDGALTEVLLAEAPGD